MMPGSIHLSAVVVEQLDHLAQLQGVRRSDVIRDALTGFSLEEAEHALDVLRRSRRSRRPARPRSPDS